ncbi:MAG: flagellar hook-basal body complex protein FliE [Pseudomonadota bacterium]|nr:flagellar hook-basal body complex protein FliE [Pseudomonadota bacterium]
MISSTTPVMNVNQVLAQIRAYSRMQEANATAPAQSTNFSQVLAASLDQVSAMQQDATRMKTSYEIGDPSVDLPNVMISMQKASLAFEATVEVRNKLLNAYQEVMNMQV